MLQRTVGMLLLICLLFSGLRSQAQATEAQQLALNIQKLAQFRKILKNMYDAYRILSQGYNKVKDITSGNYSIHEAFLDGLIAVSPAVRNYSKVADILQNQAAIIKEYRNAYNRFKDAGIFSTEEISYLGKVYDNLLDRSISNVNELTMVLTASKLRMSDDERLTSIDRLADEIQEQLSFLRSFNNKTGVLAMQRIKEKQDVSTMRKFYNVKP